ncbi:MAG: DUF4340 domain-containing protein [Ruminococcus sp.]|nr:DUF4340 domain-containing protein [Ruminococcus sp.]
MNGKLVGIIVCVVVLLSLGGVMLFLKKTAPKDGQESSQVQEEHDHDHDDEEEASIIVLGRESEEISSVHVVNGSGEFDVTRTIDTSGTPDITVPQLSGISQNSVTKNGMFTIAGMLEAYKLVEEDAPEVAKYGLEEPAAQFTVTYNDGEERTLYIGDEVPNNERYMYVRLADEKNVYMMLASKMSYFLDPVTAYVNLALISEPDNDNWPEYGKEVITRSDWDYEVTFENDPNNVEGMISSQVISSPIFAYLNITGSTDVTHGMWGLAAEECVEVKPDEETLAGYGLDEPRCTVSLKGEGYDYLLKVGDQLFSEAGENEVAELLGYYCTVEGIDGRDCVYLVSESNLPWVTFKIEDVITTIMLPNYLVDLDTIDIEANGEVSTFEITSNGTSKELNEDGSAAAVTSVKYEGRELAVDNFKTFYQFVMTCPTDELCFDEPEGDYVVKVTEHQKDGGTMSIELYKDTARRYIVKLNGKASYRIPSTWADTLLEDLENVKVDGAIKDSY